MKNLHTMPLKNERPFTEFENGARLFYAQGNWDDWAVYYSAPGIKPYKPQDKEYFNDILLLANTYGTEYVYEDFVRIFEKTTREIDYSMADFIKQIAKDKYNAEDVTGVAILFTTLYMAMVSEYYYHGKPSKINKRIKRLGVYQILYKGMSVGDAANFSKGKDFSELDALCKQYGF